MANRFRFCSRTLSSISLMILAVAWTGAPAIARAENNCPWMNEATASDLLGGDAVGAYVTAEDKPSVCTFTQRAGNLTRTLQISVEIAADPHSSLLTTLQADCHSTPTPLSAIGNEADTCVLDRGKAVMGERAMGRVRDQVFTITISTSEKDDPVLSPATLKMKISAAAEQVAGNLF